jgi:hypothetical protein
VKEIFCPGCPESEAVELADFIRCELGRLTGTDVLEART